MKKTKKTPKYPNGGSIYDESTATNKSAEGMAGQVLPWMQFATGLRDMGQSMLPKDEAGNIQGGGNKAANEWMTADHTHMINAAKQGDAAGVLRESAGMGKIGRSISQIGGKDEKTDGFWGKFNKAVGMPKEKELSNPNAEIQAEINKQDMLNKLQYGTFQFGGIAKQWGITPNAEVEKQENAIHPDGQFRQFNGPSHENGGIQTHLPEGTKVFSDKLKMPKTGKTFAELNKANDTRKEDKIINNPNATTVEKATASLMKLAKQKSSDMLFSTQEALKQSKVNSYTKRMGGIQKYTDGGYAAWRKQKEAAGWVQSPLADPKSPYPDMYDPKALEIQKASNVGLNDHVWKAYDNTDYTYKALNPKALDAYGYKSPDFYGSYTPPAKTMSTPQFKAGAGYTPSPQNDGSYMMINDSNPNARYQYVGGKYQLIQKQAYGGVQKFKNGGESEEPSFGYTPDNLAGQYKLQQAYNNQKLYEESLAQYEGAMNEHNKYSSINPNNPYNPTFDFNMPVGGKLDQAILRDKNYSYKEDGMPANAGIPSEPNISKEDDKEDDPANSNWQNYLTQAALFTGNNLGNFYDLARASEVEQDKYGKLQPKLLDPTAALRTNKQVFRNVNESLKDAAGGHAGAYMSNRIASGAKESIASDDIRREYYNRNVGIENTAQQYNIEQQKAEDIANMQNRAKSRDIKGNAISNIGSNTVSQYKDSKMTKADMDKIELIKQMYPSIKNNPDIVAYYKKKYPSVKWDEIEKSNK